MGKGTTAWTRILILAAVCLAILAGWFFLDERTRLTVFKPNGFIVSGEALGVAIGDSRDSALQKLRNSGMAFQGTQNGGTCFFREVQPGRELDTFFVSSWHGGMVCIVSRNERVEELIWAFQPVSL